MSTYCWSASETDRVRQVVDVHGKRNRDDVAFGEALNVRAVAVKHVAVPLIAGLDQVAHGISARRSAWTEPAARPNAGDGFEDLRGLLDVEAIFVGCRVAGTTSCA